MAPEELHEARKAEAIRLCLPSTPSGHTSAIDTYARLVRENWTPVDPDLIAAREVWAKAEPNYANEYLAGKFDSSGGLKIALAAIKRGRELERGE